MSEPIGLRSDKQWKPLENRLCRISNFRPTPGSKIENGEVISPELTLPYASFDLECERIPEGEEAVGLCTHKLDFESLWSVFMESNYDFSEMEVLMIWSSNHYNNFWYKFVSQSLPKMVVFVANPGTYEAFKEMTWPKDKGIGYIVNNIPDLPGVVRIPVVMQKK